MSKTIINSVYSSIDFIDISTRLKKKKKKGLVYVSRPELSSATI